MKLTRDGAIWWILMIGALATALGGHYDLLTKAFPGMSPAWQARIELTAFLSAVVAGYLRMSPMPLSSGSELASREHGQALTVTGKLPDV